MFACFPFVWDYWAAKDLSIKEKTTFWDFHTLSAICLHAFWTPLCHMKLLRPGKSGLDIKKYYYSFKILLRFWLAHITCMILHNQLPLAKCPVKWRRQYRLSPLKSTATEKPWEPGWSELTNFYSLFLCPLECSVNGVNFLTHITLTRVTEFFSDVKSGFDSKRKTETNKKDQTPINAAQNECIRSATSPSMTKNRLYVWPKGSKHSYQRYYDLPFVVFTIASISIGYFVSLWVMSVMHSGIDSRRVCLFRLHLCKNKQRSQGTSFPNLKLVLFIVLPINFKHE